MEHVYCQFFCKNCDKRKLTKVLFDEYLRYSRGLPITKKAVFLVW
jgi:hypothetical protein